MKLVSTWKIRSLLNYGLISSATVLAWVFVKFDHIRKHRLFNRSLWLQMIPKSFKIFNECSCSLSLQVRVHCKCITLILLLQKEANLSLIFENWEVCVHNLRTNEKKKFTSVFCDLLDAPSLPQWLSGSPEWRRHRSFLTQFWLVPTHPFLPRCEGLRSFVSE
jgi:hypothetical protein